MNRLWKCPRETCEGKTLAVRAPSKMRKDDVRRYCIPCSVETGRLVPRVCDALEKKRAARREQSKEERHRERAREQAAELRKWSVGTMDLRVELDWLVKHFELARLPTISITRGRAGSRGRAYYGTRQNPGSISLTIGERSPYGNLCAQIWEYLLHEVIHSFGLPHGKEMCAEVDRACLARWGVDVSSGAGGYPTGRVGTEKTYGFDRLAVLAICEAVAKVYTSPPTRAEKLKAKWGEPALRIKDNTTSSFEIDAVIIDPVESSNSAAPEDRAMVAWLQECRRRKRGWYIIEVTKDTLPHARVLIRELNEWAWDARQQSFTRWADRLLDIVSRIEKETP